MAEKKLLKNGVVIIHDTDDTARGVRADLLIDGDKITQIKPDIGSSAGVTVIDCTDKVIAPGFIDTHRHMYNIALRGRHGDDLLPDYLVKAKVAISATVASGLRSIYGYCFNGRVDSWSPFSLNPSFIAPFALDALKRLASSAPFGNGRITLGVAFDGWFLPKDMIVSLFQNIKTLGIRHVTTHNSSSPPGRPTSIETMHSCGVLTPDSTVILAHANNLAPNDIKLVKENGAYLSSTPSVELQMGMGTPICFDPARDVQANSSLGVDCHNVVLTSIVSEMRCALAHSRSMYNDKFRAAGKMAAQINHTVQEAYALGTIQGARAVGLENEIGSLAVGKKADIIVFDALAPSMICGAQHDPITAIVMHSTPGDIVMTFVDGILRKDAGKLLPMQITSEDAEVVGVKDTMISWSDVTRNLLKTQESVQARLKKLDLEAAKKDACTALGMDTSIITSKL
ncbi:hypothetical protein H2200_011826 [Cladophialophora chaetospira]|uniref:Amidohydrolase-related domain-containing protein n=1 Tax=Cladophialophora chaetospira TaxID=386627 RepID=A0AA38WYU1_9EURO|nr:hypothetical protein H2200_011826 [Cladophialophora chaetospira]